MSAQIVDGPLARHLVVCGGFLGENDPGAWMIGTERREATKARDDARAAISVAAEGGDLCLAEL